MLLFPMQACKYGEGPERYSMSDSFMRWCRSLVASAWPMWSLTARLANSPAVRIEIPFSSRISCQQARSIGGSSVEWSPSMAAMRASCRWLDSTEALDGSPLASMSRRFAACLGHMVYMLPSVAVARNSSGHSMMFSQRSLRVLRLAAPLMCCM